MSEDDGESTRVIAQGRGWSIVLDPHTLSLHLQVSGRDAAGQPLVGAFEASPVGLKVRLGSDFIHQVSIHGPELRKAEDDLARLRRRREVFSRGDKVTITDGPYRGCEAEILKTDMFFADRWYVRIYVPGPTGRTPIDTTIASGLFQISDITEEDP